MTAALDVLRAIDHATARDRTLIAARHGGGRRMESADKVTALLDAARALADMSAPYALIGGVAVGIHSGVPRATLDTALAVRSTTARRDVIDAFRSARFEPTGEFQHSVNFRHVSGEPVQVVFDPGFDDMIDRAEAIRLAGGTVRVVRKSDLIAMKERAAADPGRRRSMALRDQADVALLRGDVPDPDEGW